MLADISGFSKIMQAYDNRNVTDFLCRFHAAMQDVVFDHGGYVRHESGDSFWALSPVEADIKEIGLAAIKAYEKLISGYDAKSFPLITQTKLRMAYDKGSVIAYEVDGERHYNSRVHAVLRNKIEILPRDHSLVMGPQGELVATPEPLETRETPDAPEI